MMIVKYLGTGQIRVAATADVLIPKGGLAALAAAGIHFDMLMPSGIAPSTTIAALDRFALANAGSIMAIEGPNEINNFPISYGGMTGLGAGIAFENTVAADMAVDPALAGIALYNLTGASRSAQLVGDGANFVNLHPYPTNGQQPGAYLLQHVAQNAVAGKGIVITEAGYMTGSGSSLSVGGAAASGVDALTQAKETLNLIADAATLGVADTFLYELKDYASTAAADNFGLFGTAMAPKPAAVAIHNLTTILADTGSNAATFATTALNYMVSCLPSTGNSLLLEKSGGVHDLLVWAEPNIWNSATHSEIHAAATPVTVTFASAVNVEVFDPLVSSSDIASYNNVTTITLAITDHPLVVQITGGAAAATSASAVYATPIWQTGTSANEALIGGGGNDRLTAGPGHHTLYGGAGADLLTAGSGQDTFVYKALGDSTVHPAGQDTIVGFNHNQGDRIDLSALDASLKSDASLKLQGGVAFHLAGSSFTGHAGDLIQIHQGNGYLLEGDATGSGSADFAILLSGLAKPLVQSDFLF